MKRPVIKRLLSELDSNAVYPIIPEGQNVDSVTKDFFIAAYDDAGLLVSLKLTNGVQKYSELKELIADLSLKADLVNGKVPSNQLPSYVDDVLEYANLFTFPTNGQDGKIYIALDTNKTYRWGGSTYVELGGGVALGETSSTSYRGDKGKTAYDHSQLMSGNPHNVTKTDVGLGNVDNTSDLNKPISTTTQTALDGKVNNSAIGSGQAIGASTTGNAATATAPANATNFKTALATSLQDVTNVGNTTTNFLFTYDTPNDRGAVLDSYGVQGTNSTNNSPGNLSLQRFGGNVGVGTTDPENPLTVNGLAGFYPKRISGGDARAFIIDHTLNNPSFLSNEYPIVLRTGGGNQPLILDAARIGIGTTSPSFKLDVNGTGKFAGSLNVDGVFTVNNNANFSGNVGIGTTNPIPKFQVKTGTDHNLGFFEASTGVRLSSFNDAATANIAFQYDGSVHQFLINGVEKATIANNGNVGIGTTSPSEKLDVNGSIKASNVITVQNLKTNTPTNTGASLNLFATRSDGLTGTYARINGYRENVSTNNKGYFSIETSSTDGLNLAERLRIIESGNVGIGTTTPTAKLQVIGLAEYTDNTTAISAGLTAGAFYRTGDLLKVVH